MDKFIKSIEAYEQKMISMIDRKERQEKKAKKIVISTWIFIAICLYILLNWKEVKKDLISILFYLDTLWDWLLVKFFNYKIIIE